MNLRLLIQVQQIVLTVMTHLVYNLLATRARIRLVRLALLERYQRVLLRHREVSIGLGTRLKVIKSHRRIKAGVLTIRVLHFLESISQIVDVCNVHVGMRLHIRLTVQAVRSVGRLIAMHQLWL